MKEQKLQSGCLRLLSSYLVYAQQAAVDHKNVFSLDIQ